jgi:hypothetical protein
VLDKQGLSDRVRPVDPTLADDIAAPESEVEVVPTSFLVGGNIYRVTRSLATRPIVFTVGVAGDYVASLAGRPAAYVALARHGRLDLSSSDKRRAYVTTYLETTRSYATRFELLRSIDQLSPRANLSPTERGQFDAIRSRYSAALQPLELSVTVPWRGSGYAVKGQDLVRYDMELSATGEISAREEVLEADLPIPRAQ